MRDRIREIACAISLHVAADKLRLIEVTMERDKKRATAFTKLAIEALEDKKAVDVRLIDISEVSVLADYFLIASGTNRSQIQAMADSVQEKLGRAGCLCRQTEGYENAAWVLLDFGDLIVHIFNREDRLLYDLERIWRDGKSIDPTSL